MLLNLEKVSPKEFQQRGEKATLKLFHEMAERVPAYQEFLKKHGVKAKSIKKPADLRQIPIMTKQNYLNRFPRKKLVWDGDWSANVHSVSVSSGSTGQPYFWPIGTATEADGEFYYETVLKYMFRTQERSTLAVVCYALGTWIAGTYTVKALTSLSERYPITVTSPGLNIGEALRLVRELGPQYDQVLLIGYGPFLKDILDTGAAEGVNWKKLKTKLQFAGEPFNESWRQYVLELVGSKSPLSDAAGGYAACDTGYMAVETPVAIKLRQLSLEDPELTEELYHSESLYGSRRMPTLQQYDPSQRFFDATADGELLVSGNAAIPLMRYNMLDQGGLIGYDSLPSDIRKTLEKTLSDASLPLVKMPFIYVYGRRHNAATIYAVTVWPENIRAGIENREIRHLLSGKHKMQTRYNATQDQYLNVQIELARGVKLTRPQKTKIQKILVAAMMDQNIEYRELVKVKRAEKDADQVYPNLEFLAYGDAAFKPGAKLAAVAKVSA